MASSADIAALVRRLRSPRRLEQVQAADALACGLSGDVAAVQALVDAGGCAALARVVVSGSSQAGQRAAARAVIAAHDTAAKMAAADSLPSQLAEQAGEEAACSLPALLPLLRSSASDLQGAAAILTCDVALGSGEMQSALMDAGGLPALLDCLCQHAGPNSQPQQECSPGYCALTLVSLCISKAEVRPVVAAAGGAAALVPLLANTSKFVRLATVQALQQLAEGCPEGQQAAAAAGAIPALTRLLASSTDEAANIAAIRTLLAVHEHWSADAQLVAGSIPGLVRTLQHSQDGMELKAALSILCNIWESGGQPELRAMAAAGAAPALQRYLGLHAQDAAADELLCGGAAEVVDVLNRLRDR